MADALVQMTPRRFGQTMRPDAWWVQPLVVFTIIATVHIDGLLPPLLLLDALLLDEDLADHYMTSVSSGRTVTSTPWARSASGVTRRTWYATAAGSQSARQPRTRPRHEPSVQRKAESS